MTFHKGALYVATLRSEALIRLRIEGRRVLSIERLFAGDEYDGVLGRLRDAVDGPVDSVAQPPQNAVVFIPREQSFD